MEYTVDCSELSEYLSVNEVKGINHAITAPDEPGAQLRIGGLSSEFEVNRDEDYHYLRNPGILETLVETKLPYECKENNELLWLTSKIITHIAQNQAFSEGNKRTSYITGVLFMIKVQLEEGDQAKYPLLDRDFTEKLQKLAVKEMSSEELYNYLKEELG